MATSALSRPTISPGMPRLTRFLSRILAVPLLWKLAGANALVLVTALLGAAQASRRAEAASILVAALALTFIVNLVLVWIALRPLAQLEGAARRVSEGDLAARVPSSVFADRNIARIGRTLNVLLDRLIEDRARLRLLATQVIRAQDVERARLARELHDSTAQTLAAAKLQLRAASRLVGSPDQTDHLEALHALVSSALEETRSLSHLLYPRVLDDLGLVAALEWLARQSSVSGVVVEVESELDGAELSDTTASVLYRVAQEGLRNALTHARARRVRLRAVADAMHATIEIIDDGRGFDVDEAERRRPGMGLFAVRERVALVGGRVELRSTPGHGTRLRATVPRSMAEGMDPRGERTE